MKELGSTSNPFVVLNEEGQTEDEGTAGFENGTTKGTDIESDGSEGILSLEEEGIVLEENVNHLMDPILSPIQEA